jgi:multidrug efflux system outer membrane protein
MKVGPDYQRPVVNLPDSYRTAEASPATLEQNGSLADLSWWEVFRDPALQDLIRTALKQNFDLLLAAERVETARAQLGITRSSQYPRIDASGTSSGGKDAYSRSTGNFFVVGPDVSFQLDLLGARRRAIEAGEALVLATEEARKTVLMTLVSEVAGSYFQLLSLDQQLEIARKTITTQEESLKLTSLRTERGVAPRVDVL